MLVLNEKLQNTERFLEKVNREKEEHERLMREEANIKRDLRSMSRDSKSVERGERRLKKFNERYVGKLARLGRIRQTHNDVPDEDVKSTIREWKENL